MARKRTSFQWVAEGVEGEAFEGRPRPDRHHNRQENVALEELAEALVLLPAERRAALPLDEDLRAELELLAAMPHDGAWRRQLRRVAGLLREEDPAPLQAILAGAGPADAWQAAAEHHARVLLDGDDAALQALVDAHPALDRNQLRALLRQARGEGAPAARAARRLVGVLARAKLPL